MGWLIAVIVVVAYILSIYLSDKRANISLIIAIIVPFGLYLALGRFGGEVVFTIFATIVVIILNILSRSKLDDDKDDQNK